MDIETFLAIVCFGIAVICGLVSKWCRNNTYLTYKEQKVGK